MENTDKNILEAAKALLMAIEASGHKTGFKVKGDGSMEIIKSIEVTSWTDNKIMVHGWHTDRRRKSTVKCWNIRGDLK